MPAAKKESPKAESHKIHEKEPEFKKLYRSENDKVIAGIAGGLGEYFNIDPTIIRILFVLLAIFGGSGLVIYIVLWLILPSASSPSHLTSDSIRSNIEDMKSTTQSFAHNISSPKNADNSKFWWAIIIIAIGFLFLLNNYGILRSLDLDRLWPLALIIFGLAILLRK